MQFRASSRMCYRAGIKFLGRSSTLSRDIAENIANNKRRDNSRSSFSVRFAYSRRKQVSSASKCRTEFFIWETLPK